MSLDRKTLEAVLGLPRHFDNITRCYAIPVDHIESLLKGLTEAGDGRRVMVMYDGKHHHYEDHDVDTGKHEACGACASAGCTPAPDTEETRAWVARQRKDSHAGA